jgi:SprT protein
MPKKESPLDHLREFLPEGTFEEVLFFLKEYKVHLTITRARQTVLGDYRNSHGNRNHRISINGNLNPYAFLITLLHELGHLLAFEKYGAGIAPHGQKWKQEFGTILARFVASKVFPADIEKELLSSLKSPAASSCAEEGLLRILKKYDPHKPGFYFVEELPLNSLFRLKGGKIYCRGNKVRKRYMCKEMASGKLFLFSPVAEVEWVGEFNDSHP